MTPPNHKTTEVHFLLPLDVHCSFCLEHWWCWDKGTHFVQMQWVRFQLLEQVTQPSWASGGQRVSSPHREGQKIFLNNKKGCCGASLLFKRVVLTYALVSGVQSVPLIPILHTLWCHQTLNFANPSGFKTASHCGLVLHFLSLKSFYPTCVCTYMCVCVCVMLAHVFCSFFKMPVCLSHIDSQKFFI